VYRRLCHHLGIAALSQARITTFVSELDILGIVNTIMMSRGRYGRTKEISLSVPDACVQQVLFEDYKLKALSDLRIKMQTTL
jgi:cell division control protein 6